MSKVVSVGALIHEADRSGRIIRRIALGRGLFLLGILLSQVFPTFGARLGTQGNWIPLLLSASVLLSGLGLGKPVVGRSIRIYPIIYLLVATSHTLVLMLVSPFTISIADFADVVRWIILACALLSGYTYAVRDPLFARKFYRVLLVCFGLVLLLWFDYRVDRWSPLQQLYVFRTMGHGRFAGNWNFPYNLSVFLVLSIIAFLAAIPRVRYRFSRLVLVTLSAAGMLMLADTQARIVVVALPIAALALLFVCGAYAFVSSGIRPFLWWVVMVVVIVGVIGALGYLLFFTDYGRTNFPYLVTIANVQDMAEPRLDQIAEFGELIEASPLRLILGFGPSRGTDLWLENLVLYVMRFGLLGFIGYFAFLFAHLFLLALNLLLRKTSMKETPLVEVATMVGIVYLWTNAMSNNIFFHYRFMPMGYFGVGVLFAYLDQELNRLKRKRISGKGA